MNLSWTTQTTSWNETSEPVIDPQDVFDVLNLRLIGEVFSPPRFTEQAVRHQLQAGRAYDLQLGNDFCNPAASAKSTMFTTY